MFILVGSVSLLYSRDVQLIASAFARRISILVDNTATLQLLGTIWFAQAKGKGTEWIVNLNIYFLLFAQAIDSLF